jgi:hypothetical protein
VCERWRYSAEKVCHCRETGGVLHGEILTFLDHCRLEAEIQSLKKEVEPTSPLDSLSLSLSLSLFLSLSLSTHTHKHTHKDTNTHTNTHTFDINAHRPRGKRKRKRKRKWRQRRRSQRRRQCKRRTLRLKLNESGMFVPCECERGCDILLKSLLM